MSAVVTTSLLLVRHGQSVWNAEGRWQGQADPPLSDHGREQAFAAAAAVGNVDLIASSPQQRALETATIISEQLGVGPVVELLDIRERSAGTWSGLTRADIDAVDPGAIEARRWPDGWEHDEQVFARADAALRSLAAAVAGGTALVVSHGGVIRTIEARLGLDEGRVPNLSGRVLTLDHRADSTEGRWSLGDQLPLVQPEISTGGDGFRV